MVSKITCCHIIQRCNPNNWWHNNDQGKIFEKIGVYFKVYKCLGIVLTKLYNKDFGFGSKGYNEIEEFIGIPYLSANKPAHNSKFSEIDITTIMTAFCLNSLSDNEHDSYMKTPNIFIIINYISHK